MNGFVKVLFKDESHFNNKIYKYKIGEENIANSYDNEGNLLGFNFSNYENIARWLVRGDTLYDVEIPKDTKIEKLDNPSTPNGVFRANKIILKNPRKIDDNLALELYKISNMPEKTYFKTLSGYAVRGYINSAKQIIKDKVNKSNIDIAISEYLDFYKPNANDKKSGSYECYMEILNMLIKISEKSKE